jgi:hypothetical protein
MNKLTPDRIAELKAKKDKLGARIAKLEASAKAENRKRDQRRAMILGTVALASIDKSPGLVSILRPALQAYVEAHPKDRDIIADLLALRPNWTPAPPPMPKPDAFGAGASARNAAADSPPLASELDAPVPPPLR